MNANDKRLLLSMMNDHAEELGNAGCNDWAWPASWNEAYRREFYARMQAWQPRDLPPYHHIYGPPDFIVWAFLTSFSSIRRVSDED